MVISVQVKALYHMDVSPSGIPHVQWISQSQWTTDGGWYSNSSWLTRWAFRKKPDISGDCLIRVGSNYSVILCIVKHYIEEK